MSGNKTIGLKLFSYCTVILLIFAVSIPLNAQSTDLERSCSVRFKSLPLEEVLVDFAQRYQLEFSYSPVIIPENALVDYRCDSCQIKQALKEILFPFYIDYQIVGKHIVLIRSSKRSVSGTAPKTERYTVSGYIVDEKTEEALIGAAIYNSETGIGTISNNYGFYSLTLPEGDYQLRSSYLGYREKNRAVHLNSDISWNIKMSISQSFMTEVTVNSRIHDSIQVLPFAAETNISLQQIAAKSTGLGIDDFLKTLENQPGVNFQGDGSSYFYVRGGNRDQNLVLLDEAPIYNPSHVFGLFTPITTDVIKKTTIYKADFPIQQGGRLSSLIDIRTKDGNMEKLSGMASVGILYGMLNLEGPFKKERSSYFVSYRRSYIGSLIKRFQPSVKDLYFDDFTLKLNFRIGEKDRLFLTSYTGNDKFLNNTNNLINGLEWGNQSFTARWNHIFGPRLFANTTFYTSKYDYRLHTDYANNIYWNSHISSVHLKSDITYYRNTENKLFLGAKICNYFFNPGNYTAPDITPANTVSKVRSRELDLYAGSFRKLTNRITLNYGIRMVSWSNLGKAFVVSYENGNATEYNRYENGTVFYSNIMLEPRISGSYKLNKNGYLNASYNRTTQHINLINNSISPFNSLEVWLPAGPNIKPQKADILNVGFVQSFRKQQIEFNADLFYKLMYNQIGYKNHAQTVLNPLIEGELLQGNGLAYGFEMQLTKKYGRLNGEISYAYIRSMLQIDGLNNDEPFPSVQDKPFNFTFNLNYRINPGWNTALNILYNSGMRYTTPTAFYVYKGYQVPVYSKLNNQRLPDYNRVDLSTDILLNKPVDKTEHHLIIAVYNLLNSKNYAFLYFNKMMNDNGQLVVPTDQQNNQELVPSYRYIYSMIPTITYKLSF
ncbi:carboxypeptidase-like regulatory domain-containing protein [Saccharicrinis sp. FJH54]|uniref:TonB-dependent receptor n=1 Tax=Saccharicrinis sp. FJH54 TaxID=3344665 RepID=UPI0035D424E9